MKPEPSFARKHTLGICALSLGTLALGLSLLPAILWGMDLPLIGKPPPPTPEPDRTYSVKVKGVEFSFGVRDGNTAETPPTETSPDNPEKREQLRNAFTLASLPLAALGLILGPIAWSREGRSPISGTAIGVSAIALTWHFILVGLLTLLGILLLLAIIQSIGLSG